MNRFRIPAQMVFAACVAGVIAPGCAHPKKGLRGEIAARADADELISVEAALNLARTSYIAACVDSEKDRGVSGYHARCVDRAERHVRENVLSVLDAEMGEKK